MQAGFLELEETDTRARLRIDQADAVEWVRALPPRSVDLFCFDPAYESLEKHRNHGTTVRLQKWFDIFPNARFEELWHALYVALRNDRHLYVLCDQETGFYLRDLNARLKAFTFWKAIIWDKVTMGMGYHYRARHEWVLFFEKGSRRLNNLGTPDVLSFPRVRDGYPTEKPVDLMKVLIEQSTAPGDVVADCFTGSGSCAQASLELGRKFWGCDKSADAVGLAIKRV
ncbi:MAG TPA: site-specific DNA-methyltransferase, partial [Polyangiales bacterium]|nr:site-specific DNA-methyltransferase [Polyangiales bacterium]